MSARAEQIPDAVARLLWDLDVATVDPDLHRAVIFERVMSRGTWEAMCWLRGRYTREQIGAYVLGEGARRVPPRDLAYWALVAGVEPPPSTSGEQTSPSRPRGGRPWWAGP